MQASVTGLKRALGIKGSPAEPKKSRPNS